MTTEPSVNSGDEERVRACRSLFAELIDQMDYLRGDTTDSEVRRMTSIAITEMQTAQMWAVRALTWGIDE